jgi:ABC-2 type transport system ATP-binding protein
MVVAQPYLLEVSTHEEIELRTENMPQTILRVHSISKGFMNVKAVDNISFNIEQGDIYAFLGPNGAGKTTTLRMLLDIIKPDSGQIEWNLNGNQNNLPHAAQIGYLPEERGLYLDIPIIKSLVYLASIRGMDKAHAKKTAMEWLERLGLANRAKEKLQVLSKGNQQKIQFVASILHKPEFTILDEPFSGLDPLNQEIFIGFIKEINQQGTTILLSAHQMPLIEKVANKLFLINNGKELYNGPLPDIYKEYGENVIIELQLESHIDEAVFQNLNGVQRVGYIDDLRVKIEFGRNSNLNSVLNGLSNIEGICDLTSHKPDLHEIFLQLVKKQ